MASNQSCIPWDCTQQYSEFFTHRLLQQDWCWKGFASAFSINHIPYKWNMNVIHISSRERSFRGFIYSFIQQIFIKSLLHLKCHSKLCEGYRETQPQFLPLGVLSLPSLILTPWCLLQSSCSEHSKHSNFTSDNQYHHPAYSI